MTWRIALNFEDGITRFIEARAGETIADASYRVGVNIPLDCRDGACGACKCRVEAGTYESGAYIDEALSEEEAQAGFALACQATPKSAMAVSILASSAACKTKQQDWETQLVSVERLSATSIAFIVDKPVGFSFLPGQYVHVAVPGTEQTRAYSFSSAPADNQLRFLVRDVPGGLMSGWLSQQAPAGTPMRLSGPCGAFYLRDLARPVLFLAGGTGLAPFLAMLGELKSKGTDMPVKLIYGVTNDEDLVRLDAIDRYAGEIANFSYVTCVASSVSAHARKGYVTDHITPEDLNGGDVDIYLCGPPAMVEAVRAWLAEKSLSPVAFYYEKFTPGVATPASKAA